MGGSLFEKQGARRHTTSEVEAAKESILSDPMFAQLKFLFPKDLTNKETHGDLDIIVVDDNGVREKLRSILKIKELLFVDSGCIISALFGELQVDFNFVNSKYAHFAKEYFSFNDLGNILGFYAKASGLVLGEDGLYFKTDVENYGIARNYIEFDFYKVLDRLGMDVNAYKKGFADFSEMAEFLKGSHLVPSFDSLNAGLRRRLKVRPNQKRFYELHQEGYFGTPTPRVDASQLAVPFTEEEVVEFALMINESETHKEPFFDGVVVAAHGRKGEVSVDVLDNCEKTLDGILEDPMFLDAGMPNLMLGKNFDGSYAMTFRGKTQRIECISDAQRHIEQLGYFYL
ncbi:hypothetical protein [Vibrio sp. D431a]|uniref:hypothetical protein n=1 Tax=Vibrio sp. D431a TaxID=2837388 RepID=UPI00255537B5|nr:hypothetical protein [Vibrio sp. D431a]MDK9793730.1 hypothetical protein [Vibrio sp. D431a]